MKTITNDRLEGASMKFDEVALNWDTPERVTRAHSLANSIVRTLGTLPVRTALEFGCGTGLISFSLQERFQSIYCVDSSEGMLRVLHEKIEKARVGNIFPAGVDMLAKKEYRGTFDVIYSSMVFHHITDIETQLRALHPLLAPGGLLLTIDLDTEDGSFHSAEPDFHGHNGFSREEFTGWMQGCGFCDVRFETVYKGEKRGSPYTLFLCSAKKC